MAGAVYSTRFTTCELRAQFTIGRLRDEILRGWGRGALVLAASAEKKNTPTQRAREGTTPNLNIAAALSQRFKANSARDPHSKSVRVHV